MYLILKRLFDLCSSLLVLIIILPLMLPIIILLKFTSEGEIVYLQERIGYNNKKFIIYKFVTMLKNSSKMKDGYITINNDSRLTFMGRFLRKSKINELPQLINIIKGDMSVVGPRPLMQVSFETYPEKIQKLIYRSKPGLTGIGSIIFRDEEDLITEEKNKGGDILEFYKKKIYPLKGELEIWYQNNRSLFLDLKLILITIWIIFSPKSQIIYNIFKNLPKKDF
jgi:lipopolysaccharide/colanic/teichoic acid biosynthesis glycosyltransferase